MSKNKFLYPVIVLATLISCAEQYSETYNIQGSSSVSVLDGSKLYLKALMNDELKNIDSCEVVHGSFGFTGKMDSTHIALLSISDNVPPLLVIEKGDILVKIDRMGHKVTGTPLNEQLYDYLCHAMADMDDRLPSAEEVPALVEQITADYAPPDEAASRRLRSALTVMILAHTAGRYKQQAEKWFEQLKEDQNG